MASLDIRLPVFQERSCTMILIRWPASKEKFHPLFILAVVNVLSPPAPSLEVDLYMKTLLVFCDGTGMDGSLAAIAELDSGNNTQNSNKQAIFYQSGVGSGVNFVGDLVTGTMAIHMFSKHMDLSDLPIIGICQCIEALGTTMASKICDAYVFIVQNFENGGSNLSLWVRGLLTCIQDCHD
ncbi:hypothetical protein DFH08DRAFT_815451 [Mycena albidolilacea]|uniref:T6SS Phospholipase effector Tle1-like catalytic domain-containing protein n=1 Tax=Mycena albidolilacea TaxID=1033008 RepID=A0AAD6ZMW0_9AGAR|nr:hypothetical protein DFH08DRAFT_815451 [Mycena albidolilacea]